MPATRKATHAGRRKAASILHRQLRSFFSVAAVRASSSSARPRAKSISAIATEATKSRRPQSPEEQKIYDEINERFLRQLGSNESAEKIWEDYRRLVDGTIVQVGSLMRRHLVVFQWRMVYSLKIMQVNSSILPHFRLHSLLKLLEDTPAPPTVNAKAGIMTNIMKGLGKNAKPEEYYQLARLHEQRVCVL